MRKNAKTHTETPWEMIRYAGSPGEDGHWSGWHIKQPDSGLADVAYVDDVDFGPVAAKANAAFIVTACNAHADLVAALEELYEILMDQHEGRQVSPTRWLDGMQAAMAALANARGQ